MSTKQLSKFKEDEKNSVSNEIYAYSKTIEDRDTTFYPQYTFGICSKCENFRFAESEFNIEIAKCGSEYNGFNMRLNEKTPIRNCNLFSERGKLDLNQMMDIAWIIEVDKRKVGF